MLPEQEFTRLIFLDTATTGAVVEHRPEHGGFTL